MNKNIIEEIKSISKNSRIILCASSEGDDSIVREFVNRIDWNFISIFEPLSEEFMRYFSNRLVLDWNKLSAHQKLSEDFIEEYFHKVNTNYVSCYQKLSEQFIRKYYYKLYLEYIVIYQNLSEKFVRDFENKLDLKKVVLYQKFSEDFFKEFDLTKPKNNWLYSEKQEKIDYIKQNTKYEVIDNEYIIAYKSCRSNNYSTFNLHYKYDVGNTYEANCDCNLNCDGSFGLSAWTKAKALEHYNLGKLLQIKIMIDDIGAIVANNNKIRCFKLEVLKEINKS